MFPIAACQCTAFQLSPGAETPEVCACMGAPGAPRPSAEARGLWPLLCDASRVAVRCGEADVRTFKGKSTKLVRPRPHFHVDPAYLL